MVQELEEKTSDTNGSRRVKVTLYMPHNLLVWLRNYCQGTGVAQSRLLTKLLREYRDKMN